MHTLLQTLIKKLYTSMYKLYNSCICTLYNIVQIYYTHNMCDDFCYVPHIKETWQRDLSNQIFHKWPYFKPFTHNLKANQVVLLVSFMTFFYRLHQNK
jgi:hypothetical protein